MTKNKNLQKKKVLAPNKEEKKLLKLSEEDEKRSNAWWVEANMTRGHYLGQRAMKLRNSLNRSMEQDNYRYKKLEEEYYQRCDELVELCQTPFRDEESTSTALDYLLELYDPLISDATRKFCSQHTAGRINPDFEEWKQYTRSLFCRLITGDTSKAINVFAEKEPNTFNTKQFLCDIKVHGRKNSAKEAFEAKLDAIKDGVYPDDYQFARVLFDEELKTFGDWVNQPKKDFKTWVRGQLLHNLNRFRAGLKITESVRWRNYYHRIIPKLQLILGSRSIFLEFIERNRDYLEKQYKIYCKGVYKDERFNPREGKTLTMFMKRWLPQRLEDLWRSKEQKRRMEKEENTYPLNEEITVLPEETLSPTPDQTQGREKEFRNILTQQEQTVLEMKLENPDIKQKEIAQTLSITPGCVSQIFNRLEQKARDSFGDHCIENSS